jgi:hypothetical protein
MPDRIRARALFAFDGTRTGAFQRIEAVSYGDPAFA